MNLGKIITFRREVTASVSHLRTRGLSPLLADVLTCVLTFVATAIDKILSHVYRFPGGQIETYVDSSAKYEYGYMAYFCMCTTWIWLPFLNPEG